MERHTLEEIEQIKQVKARYSRLMDQRGVCQGSRQVENSEDPAYAPTL
jgi:hypothetical protein